MRHKQLNIGFIGGGNMARAIITGLIGSGHEPGRIHVADPSDVQRSRILDLNTALQVTDDNVAVAEHAEILVLAVKPQIIAEAVAGLSGCPGNPLVISIAAGISLERLESWLGPGRPLIRVMPNQPAMVGAGMSVLVASESAGRAHREQAEYVTEAMGTAVWIDDEALMDTVTAISGSGPAYFYLLMEIMADCAREMGLPAELAETLVRQTTVGAARSAEDHGMDIGKLRESVTSKGGTTDAALSSLEAAGIRDIFRKALKAARDRSIELGKPGRD